MRGMRSTIAHDSATVGAFASGYRFGSERPQTTARRGYQPGGALGLLAPGFHIPAPIAARVQRSQIPLRGQAHAIRGQRCPARFKECKASAHQVATAGSTHDIAIQRWPLDEQLTEDADRAW